MTKRCKVCKEKFTPIYLTTQPVCNKVECISEWGRIQREKQQEARSKALRKDTKQARERLKTPSDVIREAQQPCNAYIRARDAADGCISCDKPSTWGGQWHASHYRPTGNCSPLRFHQLNIHKSCSECNNYKSGNLTVYRERLILKIGLENVQWLESVNYPYKWDIGDLKEIKAYYKEQLKLLKAN